MTDVHDLVWVAVVVPIGNSDHSSLSTVISMAQVVPNLCVSWKVFVKYQVNWNTLSGCIGKAVASHAEGCKIESQLWLSCTNLYSAQCAQAVLPMRVCGCYLSLDLPSLMPLSVAPCGRLQLVSCPLGYFSSLP